MSTVSPEREPVNATTIAAPTDDGPSVLAASSPLSSSPDPWAIAASGGVASLQSDEQTYNPAARECGDAMLHAMQGQTAYPPTPPSNHNMPVSAYGEPQAQSNLAQYEAGVINRILEPCITASDAERALTAALRHPELSTVLLIGRDGISAEIPNMPQALMSQHLLITSAVWNAAVAAYQRDGIAPNRSALELEIRRSPEFCSAAPTSEMLPLDFVALLDRLFAIDLEMTMEQGREAIQAVVREALIAGTIKRTVLGGYISVDTDTIVAAVERSARLLEELETYSAGAWPEVLPLSRSHGPVFPVDALPVGIREWVVAEAHATQTPVDLAAILALTTTAAVAAKRVRIRARAGWVAPLNLYTLTAMEPGSRKSAVFKDATDPIKRFESERIEDMRLEVARNASDFEVLEKRLKLYQGKAAKADAEQRFDAQEEVHRASDELAAHPRLYLPRLLCDDCTPERLEEILKEQDGKIFIAAAESDSLEHMMGRYADKGKSANIGVFLRGFDAEDINNDRVGRDAVRAPAIHVTIALAIQPTELQRFASSEHLRGKGLIARFLYSIPESTVGRRLANPAPVSEEVHNGYSETLMALCRWREQHVELVLTPEAEQRLVEYMEQIEPRLDQGGDLAVVQDCANKLAGAALRIAGNLHLLDEAERFRNRNREERTERIRLHERGPQLSLASTTVAASVVERAIQIADYFLEHVLIVLGSGTTTSVNFTQMENAHRVYQWLREQNRRVFTKRQLHVSLRTRFPHAADIDPVLRLLVERHIVQSIEDPPGLRNGRPSERYLVNPRIFASG